MPLPAAEPTAKHFQGQNRNVPHVGGGVPTPRSTTKGKPPLPANSHAPHCRARRPRRASSNTKVKPKRSANSYPSHCRERACPFRAVHGPTWKSPGECAARMRIRPRSADIRAFPAGRGKPLPYGEALADSPKVAGNVGVAAGPSGTPAPTRPLRAFRPFLPPAGEGGVRRSPARRMTEEGEPDRLHTVKSFTYSHGCGHFHIAVPSRSPSPVALVGDTLPRWGREWVRAL